MIRRPCSHRCLSILLIALVSLLLAVPVMAKSREKILTDTLLAYAATVRWGSFEQAESFIDPAYRAEHPLSHLELERYKQIRVTDYNDTAPVPVNEDEVRQTVEIGLVNVHTQQARTIIDHQVWKYDKKAKVWLLASGLPDITQRD